MDKKPSPYKFKHVTKTAKTPNDIIADTERKMGGRVTYATLSTEQRAVCDAICHWYERDTDAHPVLRFGGYAGTGKSTLVSVLAGKYSEERIAFTAFTGKATSVLRGKLRMANVPGHHEVKTLHALMYRPLTGPDGGVLEWLRRDDLEADLIVVDEASMLDEQLFDDLRSYGIPILAVGDHGQLPPVFGSFNLMEKPDLRLETIHRQAAGSPILALADFVRRIGQIPRIANTLELQVLPQEHMGNVLSSLFTTPGINHNDIGLLCYSNRERVELNHRARSARWGEAFDTIPLVGEQVICLRNVEGRIFNGMRGELTKAEDTTVMHYDGRVLFAEDEVEVAGPICKEQFGRDKTFRDFADYQNAVGQRVHNRESMGLLLDFGYAMTFHKAQGAEFEHAIVCAYDVPARLDFDTKKRALYTAITRAGKYLAVIQ